MSPERSQNAGSEILDKVGEIVCLALPAVIWALSYIQQPMFHRFYRDILPMFYPSVAVMFAFAAMKLFWPKRMPALLPNASSQIHLMKGAMIALFCAAIIVSFLPMLTGDLIRIPDVLPLVLFGAAMAVQTYMGFRVLPKHTPQTS